MDELVGDVVNDTRIEFVLPPGHPVRLSYDIHFTVTFQNDQAHLAGYRNPLMVGAPGYTLDAVSNLTSRTYHVDATNGNDNNNGLTPETAFATIQKGIDTASNGDTIIVYLGLYTEIINFLSTFSAKISRLKAPIQPTLI
jgi:hypothetical protein